MSRTTSRVIPVIALVAALVVPAYAGAVGIGDAYRDYAKDGSIDACKYSTAELQTLLTSVPTDVAQYDPRFVDELNRALDARASGACKKKKKRKGGDGDGTIPGASSGVGPGGGAGTTAPDGSPKPVATLADQLATGAPAAATATPAEISSDRGLPTQFWILVVVFGAALLGTSGWALGRIYGWSPAGIFQGLRGAIGR